MAEGAPLLREYGVYSLIEGSNPSLSAINCDSSQCHHHNEDAVHKHAPVAQLDRVSDYESEGRRFESSRARQISTRPFEGGFRVSSLAILR